MSYTIRSASTPKDFIAMARLIGEYVTWLRARYAADQWFITEVLDKQSLSSELNHLSSMYSPPNGRALVAVDGAEIVGCGAYRALADETCEMKRVFVPSRHQGRGIGRALCNDLIQAARAEGYTAMKLDTGTVMTEALSLYKALGFAVCEPYSTYPERLLPYFVFMTLPLNAESMKPALFSAPPASTKERMNVTHQAWSAVPLEQPSPLVTRQFVHGAQAMVARFALKAGALVPWHEHPNEQISLLLEGRAKFTFKFGLEEHSFEAVAGDSVVIPGGVPHQIEIVEDTVAFDVFAPPREDWLRGDDAYLRR